ncbi:hypothetical protein FHW11_000199 [Pantoea agglomerans]|nr:hypothetical protein [Pantoea agglomerans]MBA8890602.1 hypothetical protein [Pantoea agglomerans]
MGREKATFKGPEAFLMGTIEMLLATCWMVFFYPTIPGCMK